MAVARYLLDKSALARWSRPAVRAVLAPLVEQGLVATCGIVELEVLFSAQDKLGYQQMRQDRRATYEWLTCEDVDLVRALDVQGTLADQGRLRAVPLPDLMIAAIAERHRVCVLHYDADYDLIAEITTQATRWVVPPGTVS